VSGCIGAWCEEEGKNFEDRLGELRLYRRAREEKPLQDRKRSYHRGGGEEDAVCLRSIDLTGWPPVSQRRQTQRGLEGA
jgi:hypothetical protein